MENGLVNLKNMNPIQYKMLKEEMYKIDMDNLTFQLETFNNQLKQLSEKVSISEEENRKTLEVAINSMRVKQSGEGYMTQKIFGNQFTVSIGSRTVGKLFKVVGLAQHLAETTPYRQFIPKYAKSMANEKYSSFIWHYENCLNFVDKWLAENSHYETFYSKHTEKELTEFINDLYSDD